MKIDVKAIPQDRPRACHRNGITWAYKTKRNKDFEKYVADQVIAVMDSEGVNIITDIPVYLSVEVKKPFPSHGQNKRRRRHLG
ncbi:MAG: hypothetical protein IPI97_14775 [Nitrosomonas sp.]|nr:hypothetical protein [Nitrosomonas sp.]